MGRTKTSSLKPTGKNASAQHVRWGHLPHRNKKQRTKNDPPVVGRPPPTSQPQTPVQRPPAPPAPPPPLPPPAPPAPLASEKKSSARDNQNTATARAILGKRDDTKCHKDDPPVVNPATNKKIIRSIQTSAVDSRQENKIHRTSRRDPTPRQQTQTQLSVKTALVLNNQNKIRDSSPNKRKDPPIIEEEILNSNPQQKTIIDEVPAAASAATPITANTVNCPHRQGLPSLADNDSTKAVPINIATEHHGGQQDDVEITTTDHAVEITTTDHALQHHVKRKERIVMGQCLGWNNANDVDTKIIRLSIDEAMKAVGTGAIPLVVPLSGIFGGIKDSERLHIALELDGSQSRLKGTIRSVACRRKYPATSGKGHFCPNCTEMADVVGKIRREVANATKTDPKHLTVNTFALRSPGQNFQDHRRVIERKERERRHKKKKKEGAIIDKQNSSSPNKAGVAESGPHKSADGGRHPVDPRGAYRHYRYRAPRPATAK